MDAPPAPSFDMLYYGVHEHFTLLPTFQDCLAFYARYIDDGIGIWICDPDPALNATLWESFQAQACLGRLGPSFYGKLFGHDNNPVTVRPYQDSTLRKTFEPTSLLISFGSPSRPCLRPDPWGALPHPSTTHHGSLGYLSGHP
jgi:hypothetical protein